MTKVEAAHYLGISTRSVERYTSDGRLPVQYEPGMRGGSKATYNQADLDRFREYLNQRNSSALKATIINVPIDRDTPHNATTPQRVATTHRIEEIAVITQAVIAGLLPNIQAETKLTLTLREAAEWSGLPEDFLKIAIKQKGKGKRLMAIEIGHDDYRIRRTDLKKFIAKL